MCGIAGFLSKDNITSIEKLYFKYIAIQQDSRGGDGAGLGYFNSDKNPIILKGSAKDEIPLSKVEELFCLEQFVPDTNSMLVHARRTTRASTSKKNSHPFVYKKENGHHIIMVHNGTVFNYKNIATKIKFPEKEDFVDSKVIAYAIAKGVLYDIYPEIMGTMALVWMDTEYPNTLSVLVKSATDDNTKSSRPLHFYRNKNAVYISSDYQPLHVVRSLITSPGMTMDKIYSFPLDTHIHVTYNKLTKIKELTPYKRKSILNNNEIIKGVRLLSLDSTKSMRSSYNMLAFSAGKYYLDTKPVTTTYKVVDGEVIISGGHLYTSKGKPIYEIGRNKMHIKAPATFKEKYIRYEGEYVTLYFYKGYLIKDKESFIKLALDKAPDTAEKLHKYTMYPIAKVISNDDTIMTSCFYSSRPTMEFNPIFAFRTYGLKDGVLHHITVRKEDYYWNMYRTYITNNEVTKFQEFIAENLL